MRVAELLSEAILVREALFAHDQGRKTIGQGIDAGAGLGVGALVGPDNVEAGIDARDGKAVEGRMAEGERGKVVGVGKLRVPRQSVLSEAGFHGQKPQRNSRCRILTWCMISLRTSTGRSSNCSGTRLAFSLPLGGV